MNERTVLAKFWFAAFWGALGAVLMVLNVFYGAWWGCLAGLVGAACGWFAAHAAWQQMSLNTQLAILRYVYYVGGPKRFLHGKK